MRARTISRWWKRPITCSRNKPPALPHYLFSMYDVPPNYHYIMSATSSENISQQYIGGLCSTMREVPLSFEVLHQKGQAFPLKTRNRVVLGPMGQCFYNAWELAENMGLHYVEGYAVSGDMPIPLEHAWCVNDAGRVFDPTWADGHHYFGMAFNSERLAALQNRLGRFCIFGSLFHLRGMSLPAIRQLLLDAAHPITIAKTFHHAEN